MLSVAELTQPSVWVANRTGMVPDPFQKEVLDWTDLYQSWCWSRQSGKSTAAALRTAWQVMTREGQLVLMFSRSQRQSGELLRKLFDIYGQAVRKEGYDGPRRINDNAFDFSLDNGSRVLGLPGSEESILGYSPHLVILDEAAVIGDQFFKAVTPMLSRTHGTMIVASTPRGKRGFFWDEIWKKEGESDPGWRMLKIVAEQCPHITTKFLEDELRRIGESWFEQEYHCKFLDVAGALFNAEMISAIFTEDGFVIDPGAFEPDITDEDWGWQGSFDAVAS